MSYMYRQGYVPCRRLEDVSCRPYKDVPYSLICDSKGVSYRRPEDAPQSCPEGVLKTSLHGSISKAEKRPADVTRTSPMI